MFARLLIAVGAVALLGACQATEEAETETESWYCRNLPQDSFCVGQEQPTLFDPSKDMSDDMSKEKPKE